MNSFMIRCHRSSISPLRWPKIKMRSRVPSILRKLSSAKSTKASESRKGASGSRRSPRLCGSVKGEITTVNALGITLTAFLQPVGLDCPNSPHGVSEAFERGSAIEVQEWSKTSRVLVQRYSGAHGCYFSDTLPNGTGNYCHCSAYWD